MLLYNSLCSLDKVNYIANILLVKLIILMYTVTFLYNLHIYIKMAPQGVQTPLYYNYCAAYRNLTMPILRNTNNVLKLVVN